MNRLRPFQLFCCLLMTCVGLKAQQPLSFYFPDKSFINTSDPNNRNVNHPDGSTMQDLKRATAFIAGSADEFCSCTLMNNVRQDGSILVSTSAHCFPNRDSGSEIGVVLTFNYEMSDALDRGTDVDDVVITNAYNVSGTLLYKDEISDIALLQLRVEGIENWPENVYAAGWDLSIKNTLSSNISHPQGDHKKIFINPENQAFKWKDLEGFQGYAFEMNGRWNNRSTHLEGGASGSGFFNSNRALIGIYSGFHPSSDANYSSALSNAWYNADGAQDLRNWLDPDQTWITQIPGGYLTDMIPVQSDFTLDIGGGETYSSKGINPSDPSRLEEGVHHLRPAIIFNDLASSASWESILGIQMPTPHASDVVLTVHEIIWDEEIAQYREQLLYGAFTNNTISPNAPVSAGFRGAGWDCNDLPVGFPPCERNTGFWLIDRPVDWSTTIKPVFARALSLQSSHEEGVQSLWDVTIPVVIRLTNVGSESVEVRAVSYPAEVPRNARQLFKPKELAQQFRSYKYPSSQGANAGPIFINRLSAQQNGQQLQEIKSGNNGGYLNLGNPNFKIGPVKVDPTAGDLELTFDIVNQIFPYNYKVWIDYFNSDDLEGRWEIDPEDPSHSYTYNFVNDPVAHPMEEIAAGFASDGTLLVNHPLPRAREIKLNPGEKRLTRMRVAVSNELITQDGDYGIGEVEDYLIELVAPTCEELRPVEYEDFAEAVLPYCGEGGYRESKEPLADHYRESTPGSLTYNTMVANDIPYATATGFRCGFDGRNKVSLTQSCFATLVHETESGEYFLENGQLKMDVYYPVVKPETALEDLQALPVVIYAFGGGFVLNRDDEAGKNMCRWLASKGYVVAAIDYRLGMNITNGELTKRAIVRAWQDLRAAVMYWRHQSEFDDGEHKWKIDPDKIYGVGFSAGAITVLHNLFLSQDTYESERAAPVFPEDEPGYLLAASGDYTFTLTNWSEIVQALQDVWAGDPDAINHINNVITQHKTYRTYDLDKYPTYPCFGPNTPCDPGSLTEAQEEEMINLMDNTDGRLNKGGAFSGALARVDWMSNEQTRPIQFVHHQQDAVVSFLEDEPFSYLGDVANIYNFATTGSVFTPKLSGGGRMLGHVLDEGLTNFEGESLSEEHMAGGGIPYHRSMQQFGSTDKNEIEQKLMYYLDAAFTKKEAPGPASRAAHAVLEETVGMTDPEMEVEPTFKVFPNPATNQLNMLIEVRSSGPLGVHIYDLNGRKVYELSRDEIGEGHQLITLRNLELASGTYVVAIEAGGLVRRENILIKRE